MDPGNGQIKLAVQPYDRNYARKEGHYLVLTSIHNKLRGIYKKCDLFQNARFQYLKRHMREHRVEFVMGLVSLLKIRGSAGSDKNPGNGPEEEKKTIQRIIEIVILLLLATATVASAWCIYEATAWGNVQVENIGAISMIQAESIRLTDNDNMLRTIDVTLFLSWIEAASENQTGRMAFLNDRFRDEFQPAFNEWLLSAKPGEIPSGTPFSLQSYSLQTTRDLQQLELNMTARLDNVREANHNSDSYVLTTVFGALVLFFAGISGKWKWPVVTVIFIGIAMIFLVVVLQRVFTLPVIIN
jgi:hypothetical protein